MAIEKTIPKDIRKYEPKLIGPLTTRQVLCFVPAAILCIVAYSQLSKFLSTDVCLFIVVLIALPFLLLGWYKPYNMPLEKFIKTVFVSLVLAPTNRKYRTKIVDKDIDRIEEAFKQDSIRKKIKEKKNKYLAPEYHAYK